LVGLLWLGRAERVTHPDAETITRALDGGPAGAVILGNSVALAGIDADQMLALQDETGGRVLRLAQRGGQPAHWVAALRGPAGEHRPAAIVTYAPLHVLTHGALQTDSGRRLLLALGPDDAMAERALGTPQGWTAQLARGRDRAREGLLTLIGQGPARLLLGDVAVSGARQDLVTPNAAAERPSSVPGVPEEARKTAEAEWTSLPVEGSFVPDLVAAARALGARLVVVVPVVDPRARIGPPCSKRPSEQAVVDHLVAAGVAVVDLSWADVEPDLFRTRFHVAEAGRARVTELVETGVVAALRGASTACTGSPKTVTPKGSPDRRR